MALSIQHVRPWVRRLRKHLDEGTKQVFTSRDLAGFVRRQGQALGVPRSARLGTVISALEVDGRLRRVGLRREGRRSTRAARWLYVWGEASPYAIGLSLQKDSYLSHSTAMFLHGLTDQVPKTIYVNREQTAKPKSRIGLSQPAIDRAFANRARISKYAFLSEDYRYVLLSGKQTGHLGIVTLPGPDGRELETTSLERTLVDIMVRPAYAGGVYEVLRAYQGARDQVPVDRLLKILGELKHVYPYHQSMGFLMERAGYSEHELEKVASLPIKWDFYLDYAMKDPTFDEKWRLFYPKGI